MQASDVCLSRTSGLSREQRGPGKLKLAQRKPTSHVTRTPLSRSKGQRSTCGGGGYCCGLPHSFFNGVLLQSKLTESNGLAAAFAGVVKRVPVTFGEAY